MPKSTAFKTTKINSKTSPNFAGEETQNLIEGAFLGFEAAKTDAVEATRDSAIAAAKAAIASQRATIAITELLKKASNYDSRIAAENTWIVYKNSEGEIIFEGITERVLRNATRAQLHSMGNNTEDFPSDKDMYEQEGEDDNVD